MSIQDYKLTGYADNIKDLPNVVRNNAAELKAKFDGRTDKEVKARHNGLIDALAAETGAAEVGAVVPAGAEAVPAPDPGEHANVQSVLNGLKKYTDDKVIAIGAGDMTMAEYDPDGAVKAAGGIEEAIDLGFSDHKDGIGAVCQHTVVAGTHQIYNYGGGKNIIFQAAADYAEGQGFEMLAGGSLFVSCVGKTTDGEPLGDGYFVAGAMVSCLWDGGNTLNFKTGGGGGLNFKVIAVASAEDLPVAPQPNTMAIVSEMPVKNAHIVAKKTLLEGMTVEAGDVVVMNYKTAPVWLQILKGKNTDTIGPVSVVQYDGANMVTKKAYVWDGASWVSLVTPLYVRGEVYQDLTGGYAAYTPGGSVLTTYLQCNGATANAQVGLGSVGLIDVSGFTQLYGVASGNIASAQYRKIGFSTAKDGAATTMVKAYDMPNTADVEADFELDISDVMGEYYFKVALRVATTTTPDTRCRVHEAYLM
jgi:hypothetical protein